MQARYPSTSKPLLLMLDEGLSLDDNSNPNWKSDPGYLFAVEVYLLLGQWPDFCSVDYPAHSFPNDWEWISEEYPDSAHIVFKITPLGSEDSQLENVRVAVCWYDEEMVPELCPYFLELVEPWDKGWGGVMDQLVNQGPVLAFFHPVEPEWDRDKEDWGVWFIYYHAVRNTSEALTLGDISEKLAYCSGYVRNKHSRWLREWGEYVEVVERM